MDNISEFKMIMEKDFLFVVLLTAITYPFFTSTAITTTEKGRIDSISGTQRYCGRNLVNVLTMVCDGIYNHQLSTREGHETLNTKISLLREKRSIVTIFQKSIEGIRQKRGAYDECCRKGCSLDEIIGYCGNP